MDSFFGIGFAELVVILVLAGLVMGPHRIRQVARTLGRWTGELQKISRGFAQQLNAELDSLDEGDELKSTMRDLRDTGKELQAFQEELKQGQKDFNREAKSAIKEGRAMLDRKETFKPVSRPREEQEQENGANRLPKAVDVPGDSE